MSLKIEFVSKAMRPGARMTTLCAEYNISRETGYKWLNRFKREGPDGLEERSRRPKSAPLATSEDVVMRVLELRAQHPRRGAKKLARMLQTTFGEQAPSVATVSRVIKRAGLVRQRSKYARAGVMPERPNVKAEAPNEIWTIDFKGWWRSQNGDRCEPLTVRDAYSRFVLAVELVRSTTEAVRVVLERLFKKHGVPKAIQCDNGVPFISVRARGGLTKLSAWWVALGISVIRSRPGCPQDNGGHERMHRDLRQDVQLVPAHSHKAQQTTCNAWRQEFNHSRPHEALDGKTPSELYKPSPRKMLETRAFYPAAWLTRRVSIGGSIRVQMARVPVSMSLAGHDVGIEPLGATKFRLWFRHIDLGTIEIPLTDDAIDRILATTETPKGADSDAA